MPEKERNTPLIHGQVTTGLGESLRRVTSRRQGDQICARVQYKSRRVSAERAQWLQHHRRGGSKPQPT
ncbi:hypothetical protein AOLI_G00255800 [Acnodon oligacanthus]